LQYPPHIKSRHSHASDRMLFICFRASHHRADLIIFPKSRRWVVLRAFKSMNNPGAEKPLEAYVPPYTPEHKCVAQSTLSTPGASPINIAVNSIPNEISPSDYKSRFNSRRHHGECAQLLDTAPGTPHARERICCATDAEHAHSCEPERIKNMFFSSFFFFFFFFFIDPSSIAVMTAQKLCRSTNQPLFQHVTFKSREHHIFFRIYFRKIKLRRLCPEV